MFVLHKILYRSSETKFTNTEQGGRGRPCKILLKQSNILKFFRTIRETYTPHVTTLRVEATSSKLFIRLYVPCFLRSFLYTRNFLPFIHVVLSGVRGSSWPYIDENFLLYEFFCAGLTRYIAR